MPLPTYTGKVFVPQSDLSGLIIEILSIITLLSVAPEPMYAPCMMMEFLTTASLPIVTPRKRILFSTVPSILQPSATRLF